MNHAFLLVFALCALVSGLLLRLDRSRPVGESVLFIIGLMAVLSLVALCAWWFPLVAHSLVSPMAWR